MDRDVDIHPCSYGEETECDRGGAGEFVLPFPSGTALSRAVFPAESTALIAAKLPLLTRWSRRLRRPREHYEERERRKKKEKEGGLRRLALKQARRPQVGPAPKRTFCLTGQASEAHTHVYVHTVVKPPCIHRATRRPHARYVLIALHVYTDARKISRRRLEHRRPTDPAGRLTAPSALHGESFLPRHLSSRSGRAATKRRQGHEENIL